MDAQPTVSVLVTTFNRKNLVGRALDSILAQKIDFKIEIVVGDNASTDGTQGVLSDYQKRFPEIIRLRLSDKNEGICANFAKTHDLCRGKYIAICDSDDFWIDPYKLARQVDFLENNPDYNWVVTGFVCCFQGKMVRLNDLPLQHAGKKTVSASALQEALQAKSLPRIQGGQWSLGAMPHASTWLFRNNVEIYEAYYHYPVEYPNDHPFHFMLRFLGKCYHDYTNISVMVDFQPGGFSEAFVSESFIDPKIWCSYCAQYFAIIEDIKVYFGQDHFKTLETMKRRMLLNFFRRCIRRIVRFDFSHSIYWVRLSPYVDDALWRELSSNGPLHRFERLSMPLLRYLAKRWEPLFESSVWPLGGNK